MNVRPRFHCLCPECGKRCDYKFLPDSSEPHELHLECGKCGLFTAIYSEKDHMWYIGDMHYIPEADSNIATVFHRFDPSSYADVKDAIEDGLAIVEEYDEACGVNDDPCLQHCAKRRIELYKLGIDNGNTDLVPDYVSGSFVYAMDNNPDDVARIADEALALIGKLDSDGLEDLIADCHPIDPEDVSIAKVISCASDRLYQMCIDGGKEPFLRIVDIINAMNAFQITGDPRVREMAKLGFDVADSVEDEKVREDCKVGLYTSDFCISGDEFGDALRFMDAHRDGHVLSYASFTLSAINSERIDPLGDGLERLDFCIDALARMDNDPLNVDECCELLATCYRFRFMATGDWRDRKRSVDLALDMWECRDNLTSYEIVQEFFSDDSMPRREWDILARRARSMGIEPRDDL